MKPATLLAILVAGGVLGAAWLTRRPLSANPIAPSSADVVSNAIATDDPESQIRLLEGQVEYLEGQVRVLQEENAALLERLGRLGMGEAGKPSAATMIEPFGPTVEEPDLVGLGLDLVKVRELEAQPLAALPVSSEVLEAKILTWLRRLLPGDHGAKLGRALHALGWIPEALDPLPLRAELMVKQLGAWYDADDATLYVEEHKGSLAERDLFRECLGIAMGQVKREFGKTLFPERSQPLSFDELLAREAVMAGDAGLTRLLYTLRRPEIQRRQDLPPEDPDHPLNEVPLPQFFRQAHFFAFAEGFEFMQGLHGADGFAQMNAAYSRPPKTTAEVLDGERYLAAAGPEAVRAVPVSMAAGPVEGTVPFWEDVMGQYATLTALRAWNEPERAGLAVEGWVGDRLLTYPSGEGERGHAAWQTLWREEDWAEAFFRAMLESLRQRYQVTVSGQETGRVSFVSGDRYVTLLKNRAGSGVLLIDAGSARFAEALLRTHAGSL